MSAIQVKDRNGNVIDSDTVPDGGSISIGFMIMDGKSKPDTPTFDAAAQRPRDMPMSDADTARRLASRQRYINRLNDSWRQGVSQLSPGNQADLSSDFEREQAAYDRSKQQLSNRWKGGDADRATADAAYAAYKRRLEDGWRQ